MAASKYAAAHDTAGLCLPPDHGEGRAAINGEKYEGGASSAASSPLPPSHPACGGVMVALDGPMRCFVVERAGSKNFSEQELKLSVDHITPKSLGGDPFGPIHWAHLYCQRVQGGSLVPREARIRGGQKGGSIGGKISAANRTPERSAYLVNLMMSAHTNESLKAAGAKGGLGRRLWAEEIAKSRVPIVRQSCEDLATASITLTLERISRASGVPYSTLKRSTLLRTVVSEFHGR